MTKDSLTSSLSGYSSSGVTIDAVGDTKKYQDNEFGDNFYYVNVRKIIDSPDRVNYENITFVVVDEGLSSEKAYFYKTGELTFHNTQEEGDTTGL